MATEFISNSWLMPTNANAESNRVSNYSLDFDGSSQYIASSYSGDVYACSIWFKPDTTITTSTLLQYLISFGGTYDGVLLGSGTSSLTNELIFVSDSTPLGRSAYTQAGGTITNTWHHLCFNWSGSVYEIWLDGVNVQNTTTGTPTLISASEIQIGRRSTGASHYNFNGKITEVSIFDYSLSGSQVLELYGTDSAIGNPMAITNGRKPVAYYPLGNAAFNSEFLTPNGAEQDFVFQSDGSSGPIINLPSINLGTTNTISFWYYNEAWDTSQIPIGSSTNQFDYLVAISTSFSITLNRIYYSVGNPQSALDFNNTDARNILNNTNTWIHIAITRNGDSVSLYLNGSFNETLTGVGTTNDTILDTLISEADGVGSASINGKMSNVSLFNTSLPATGTESVESLYNYGTPPNISSYSNLQGWWELDASATFDGSNWSIPDASSNSNTGTSSGMTAANLVQSDLIINAPYDSFSLSFDGVDERISFTETNLGLNNSISIWFKRPSTGTNVLIGQGSAWYDYAARIESNGSIKYADRYTSPTITFDNASTKLIVNTVNTWVNIVIVRTGSTANLYVNGVDYDGSKSWGSGSEEGTVFNRLAIGGDGTSYGFNGQLSNFASWNTSLTSAQALEVYNEAKPSNLNNHSASSSLVSWYRLGAVNTFYNSTTTEFTVLDEVGTNEGTSVNMEQGDLVDGVGATGSGTSSGMSSGTNRTGDAPYSTSNSVSYNMSVTAKSTSVPT